MVSLYCGLLNTIQLGTAEPPSRALDFSIKNWKNRRFIVLTDSRLTGSGNNHPSISVTDESSNILERMIS